MYLYVKLSILEIIIFKVNVRSSKGKDKYFNFENNSWKYVFIKNLLFYKTNIEYLMYFKKLHFILKSLFTTCFEKSYSKKSISWKSFNLDGFSVTYYKS